MNHCAIQNNAFTSFEEMRSSISLSVSERRDPLVCPKPRRLGLLNAINDHPVKPLRWHLSQQAEVSDSKTATDLLDLILAKGGCGVEQSYTQVASSPPFFSGSPPSRVSNPLIQDARFRDDKLSSLSPPSPIPAPLGLSLSPSSSARKGGFVRANFGNKPAVRIEGFDCRDGRNCSIPALA